MCLDPTDVEHRVTDRTKAIVPVHLSGHPVDMDPVMEIAERHGLKVIEDVSHAHGGTYKGRLLGTIGHVGAFSLMSGKSFAVGEAGMFITNDIDTYGDGKSTRIAFSDRDLRQPAGSLPVAEAFPDRAVMIPWFKHCRPGIIEQHAAYRKVALNADQLR